MSNKFVWEEGDLTVEPSKASEQKAPKKKISEEAKDKNNCLKSKS